jgi:P-type E1-E2 ATPase
MSKSTFHCNDAKWEASTIAQIRVGDILNLEDGETIPADCILLASHHLNGDAFQMTAALDGERNFKPKKSPLFVAQNFSLLFSSARQY